MDLIQALKDNKCAFGLMSQEMQDKAKEIGKEHFVTWWGGVWGHKIPPLLDEDIATRLKPDYAEEPEVIELEIKVGHSGNYDVRVADQGYLYTLAPALCPKEGYRFVGYRYKNLAGLYTEPVIYHSQHGRRISSIFIDSDNSVIFPSHACYRRI